MVRFHHLLITAAVWISAIMVFRADFWIGDREIVSAAANEIPRHNWLPYTLWSMSQQFFPGEAWAYRIWNVTAVWILALATYGVSKEIFRNSSTISPWMHPNLGLIAAALVIFHPLCGMTTCSITHLDWQMTTAFALSCYWAGLQFMTCPSHRRLLFIMLMLGLASLSAPAGLLLSASGMVVIWKLATESQRRGVADWFSQLRGMVLLVPLAGAMQLAGCLWITKSSWDLNSSQIGLSWISHWLTQGRVFWLQLRSAVAPTNLLPDHTMAWSESWADWPAVAGLAFMLGAGILVCWLISRQLGGKRHPIAGLLFMALMPSLWILGWRSSEPLMEARWYGALPWGAIIIAWGLGWLMARWPAMALPFGVGLPAFLAFLSVGQTTHFQTADDLAQMVLRHQPHNLRVTNFLQQRQAARGEHSAVMRSSYPIAETYRSMLIYNTNNPMGRRYDLLNALRWWVEAERRVQMAVQQNFGSEYAQAYSQHASESFTSEVKHLAITYPEALPLLDFLEPKTIEPPAVKARQVMTIPGVQSATANGTNPDSPPSHGFPKSVP